MQDKDFDQLFKDKLAHAEVEAPAMLWNKIEKDIQPNRPKKRSLPIYWMAAALAIMAVGAALVFHTEEKIQLQNSGLVLKKPVVIVSENIEVADNQGENYISIENEQIVGNVDNSVDNLKSTKRMLAMQPSAADKHLPLYTKEKEIEPIDSEQTTPTTETPDQLLPAKETLIASVVRPQEKQEALVVEEIQEDRKGIRNVGDLVNFVVDKVDKREDKLIQFNTDDDDNSSLIAINIGILKFNKKNREKR